jgi:hypothetical protein
MRFFTPPVILVYLHQTQIEFLYGIGFFSACKYYICRKKPVDWFLD